MEDRHKSRIGLITEGIRDTWKLVNPESEERLPEFPPVSSITYTFQSGIAHLTLEIKAAPARIKGIVRRVNWVEPIIGSACMPVLGHTPYPEQNPMGRTLHFETEGLFAELKPLDAETEEVFTKMPFTGLQWTYREGECSITLTCLVKARA